MSQRSESGRTPAEYPRTARLNELLREIVAEELEVARRRPPRAAHRHRGRRRRATCATPSVFYDSLEGEEGDEEVLEALEELRVRLQGAIGRQARFKRTPELTFRPDLAVRQGARIEELLATVGPPAEADDAPGRGSRQAIRPIRRRRREPSTWRRRAGRPRGRRQGGRLDLPRRRGQEPRAARHPQGGPLRHARPRCHRASCCSGVGRVTRLLRYLTALPKTYTCEIVLGRRDDHARRRR